MKKNKSNLLTIDKKAFLLSIGSVSIINEQEYKYENRKSSAGPSAGLNNSLFISSNNERIRLSIKKKSPLLAKIDKYQNINIYYKNKIILRGIIEPIIAHCPDQIYITISEKCIYNCKFCIVPKIGNKVKKIDDILNIIEEATKKNLNFKSIALTSGVFQSPEKDLSYIIKVIKSIKKKYIVPIGVSIIPYDNCSYVLKLEGVSEVKYNIETFDKNLFNFVCPDLNYDTIISELKKAVYLFGKGHVFTNVIVGIGEDDNTIIDGIEMMSKNGIIVNLRPVTPNELRIKELDMQRPTKERLLRLYRYHRLILMKYKLLDNISLSMCSYCKGCDLVPNND